MQNRKDHHHSVKFAKNNAHVPDTIAIVVEEQAEAE
jgi:hypothetical protein